MEQIKMPDFRLGNLEKEKQALIAEIKADISLWKHLTSLGVDETVFNDNFIAVLDYVESHQTCDKCNGTDGCANVNRYFHMVINVRDGKVETAYEPCRYHPTLSYEKRNSLYLDFDSSWRNARLSGSANVIDITKNRGPLILGLNRFLTKEATKPFVYVSGKPRTGKSYILAAFTNEILERKLGTVAFINGALRIKELNDLQFSDKEAFQFELSKLQDVNYLIIDNFGTEYISDFVRDSILFPLLSVRANQNKPTFFISSFRLKDVATIYATKNPGSDIKAQQLHDLIKANQNQYEYSLEDIPLY